MGNENSDNLIDLSEAVLVLPEGLSGPEEKALVMLLDEIQKRTRIGWERTTTWPSAAGPVVSVGPACALDGFARKYASELAAEGSASAPEGYCIRAPLRRRTRQRPLPPVAPRDDGGGVAHRR
jgi:hypothetical protein